LPRLRSERERRDCARARRVQARALPRRAGRRRARAPRSIRDRRERQAWTPIDETRFTGGNQRAPRETNHVGTQDVEGDESARRPAVASRPTWTGWRVAPTMWWRST